ncbi:MAG: hypothetical protein ABL907_13935 [Hyphomicrobium sp.]
MALAFDDDRTRTGVHPKDSSTIEYRLIFAVSFVVFFAAALIESLLLLRWARASGKRKSVIERARDSASTCAAYAFMG